MSGMNEIPADIRKIMEELAVKPEHVRRQRRDVQLHAAVTIMPNVNNRQVIGERDIEIAQFAVQLDARFAPFTQEQVRIACTGLAVNLVRKMREAGLLRAGE